MNEPPQPPSRIQKKITLKLDDIDDEQVLAQDGQNLNIDDVPEHLNQFVASNQLPLATPAFQPRGGIQFPDNDDQVSLSGAIQVNKADQSFEVRKMEQST